MTVTLEQTQAATETEGSEINKMLPIRMTSRVVRGFGRGSSDLGIPTANLDLSQLQMSRVFSDTPNGSTQPEALLQEIPCGIYWGYCRVGEPSNDKSSPLGVVYKAALSIGYNPTYGNDHKTVEPHLIAPESDPRRHASSCGETIFQEFYEQPVRLSVVGYLRPELPFEGLDKLVVAIKKDIADTVRLGDLEERAVQAERDWVQSQSKVIG